MFRTMTISQVAKTVGVRTETVRYYQRIGLIRTPQRQEHAFRSYTDEDAAHLRFIRHGQKLGFTLEDIAALLHLSSADCEQAERLATERLVQVRAKISDLRRLESALEGIVVECDRRQTFSGCPLIEALTQSSLMDSATSVQLNGNDGGNPDQECKVGQTAIPSA